jgi:phage baseplate assembly protein W
VTARAIRFPFQFSPSKRVQENLSYDDLVRGQVIDALMTNQGERVMRPRYGCDIQAALFDPTDELVRRDAAAMLKRRLEQFVTRAIIRSVSLDTAESVSHYSNLQWSDPSMVVITVVYRAALYATDTALTVPVSSEYVRRQLEAGAPQS